MEDDQQFCLRWNNHQSTLIQNFDTLLESGTLVDCTLAAEGKYLKAHKVVLSACSPYFEGLLSEHYDKHPVFILKDVKFKELKAMMDYMYRGEVNISQDQLTALLKAAESLQIKGLSDSRTGGGAASGSATTSSKTETRSAKAASSTAATSSSLDIPHASSGLTIEKNSKVPRQSLQQVSVSDLPEDSASPQLRGLSSREGSQSPTSRKRLRKRKRSVNNDDTNSMENHEASNSSDVNISAPALGVAPVATEEKSHADPAETIGRSALMQQLTKPADEMLQIPIEKPEPSEEMIQPKSEYLDDQDDVEDLTNLDDDMNDLNEMEQDNSRAGPSHDPSQHGGIASWHISGDRSNASVVGAAAGPPGQQDEVFLAAHEAAQAQRDSQGTSNLNDLTKSRGIHRSSPSSGKSNASQSESRLRMAQRVIKKSTLNDEVKRNLSSFANTIISKMQTASNPSNSPDQNRTMVNELLAQFNMSSSIYKEEDKPQSPQSAVFEDGFQQMVIDYFTRIMDGMNDLMNEVKTVTCDTKVLKSLISNRKSEKVMNCKQLAEKYSYTIPLPTVEDFERFDRELDNPYSTLRLDLNSVLPSGLDTGLVVSKCIVKMLKMFISKDVAIQYTAVKQAKKKRIMRITNLFNSIEALIKERRSQVKLITTDKEMTAALSDVMSNAQHWKNQQQYEQNKSQTNQIDPGRYNQDPSLQSDASSSYLPSNDGYPLCEVQYLDSDKKSSRENKTLPQTVFQNDFQQMVIDYFVRIMNGMNDLTNEVRDVANDTKIIKSLFANKEGEKIMSCKQLAEKYSYTIPIPSMEEFERFDRELGNPQSSLKSDLASVLPSGLDSGLVLSKCIVKMLKMLITKDVAVQFTAVKQANRKKIMKSTNFFNSIEALIKERRSQISLTTLDKDITAALSDVMSNAPNWKRQQQADQNQHQSTWQIHQARNDQETSFQGDSMSSYELLSLNETEPLFETKYFNAL